MANRKSKRFDDSRLPLWQKRRWRLFKRALINPEFNKALPELSRSYKSNKSLPAEEVIRAYRKYGIPTGCEEALYAVLDNPANINNDEMLAQLIRPPIHYISFITGKRGVSDNPKEEFRHWKDLDDELRKKYGTNLLAQKDGLILEVGSYTTKDELKDFIDQYFDSELRPLLSVGDGYFTPQRLRAGRISAVKEIDELIMAMYSAGKKPKQITESLWKRGIYVDATNVSKRISLLKKNR